jgi:polyhydroxyalkanoate synthase
MADAASDADKPKRPRKTAAKRASGTKPATTAKRTGSAKPAAKSASRSGAKAKPKSAAKTSPPPKPEAKAPEAAPAGAPALGLVPEEDLQTLETISRQIMQASLKSQKLMSDVMRKSLESDKAVLPQADPLHAAPELAETWNRILADPELLLQAQSDLYKGYLDLWAGATRQMMSGEAASPVVEPAKGDKRWRSQDWSHPLFSAIQQSYLLNQRFMMGLISGAKGLDEATRRKAEFITRQMVDALAPTNFALTNPDVLRETFQSKGENLTRGLTNLVADLERGEGRLALSQTDFDGFKVGEDLAVTPGEVIYRNEVMELIQYTPVTETVRKRPILIAPPWINKFYILDLRPQNSMIAWLLEQGFTVFLISWVNPDASLADKTFEDYMRQGLFEALDAVETATGEKQVDAVGYCIGGTLLGSTLAYMAAKKDERIASATFFAAQLDFKKAGELLVFIDDEWFAEIRRLMDAQGGVLDGRTMADTFNFLRANDLVWSFVINNYLLGRQPQAFDLLFWNADQTRMPRTLHLWYLETFYKNNALSEGVLELGGVPLDMKAVKIPVFMQASRDDHIAPYESVYRSAKLFGGPVRFQLAGSGHIAGVINHPKANKYQHWINTDLPDTAEAWIEAAEERPGSWWGEWRDWLYAMDDTQVPARKPGGGALKAICPAPGEYVKVKS